MRAITLQLQQDPQAAGRLAVFLLSSEQQLAFSVPSPAAALQAYGAWRSRFLLHHDAAAVTRPPADVVRHYGVLLTTALAEWLQHPDWQPLRQLLDRHPSLPLLIRCQDSQLEALPWESLPLQRPIWRQRPPRLHGTTAPPTVQQPVARQPRVLLLAGDESHLSLQAEIEQLDALRRSGRIALQALRHQQSCLSELHRRLLDPSGWDVLVFLGHSGRDPAAGGRLQLGDGSWLAAAALQQELSHAAAQGLQLLLLSSCSGMDLAHTALAAGIPWTLCFREPVPDAAASAAFSALLAQLQDGTELEPALQQVRRKLEQPHLAGSPLLLSTYTTGSAPPLQLPLRRRRLLGRRLARSNPRQLAATAGCCLLAALSALVPWNPISTYLLDRRLDLQRQYRQLTAQPGPAAEALPVLLIDPRTVAADYGAAPTPGRLPRLALAAVLQHTPVAAVPRVGLDVVLDEAAPHTADLAAVLQRQQRPLVFSGWFSADTAAANPGDRTRRLARELQSTPLQTRRLDVNTPGRSDPQALQPLPLRLQEPITAEHFAAALADQPAPLLPADAVLDWSLDWSRLIRRLEPADLPALQARALLVGSTGNSDPAHPDLFSAPGAAATSLAQLSGGSARQIPGALVQAALAQSIAMGHWLRPQPLLPITALSAGLGVMLAAASSDRRRRLLLVAAIAAIAVPLSLQLAVSRRLLVPLLLPLLALASTAALRTD